MRVIPFIIICRYLPTYFYPYIPPVQGAEYKTVFLGALAAAVAYRVEACAVRKSAIVTHPTRCQRHVRLLLLYFLTLDRYKNKKVNNLPELPFPSRDFL